MDQAICSAIASRLALRFYYNGGGRIVEPFCYGVSREGNEMLRAYQIGGHSQSGKPIDWKLFRVDQISNLSIGPEKFTGNRPGYNPADPAMERIYCHV